MNDWIKAFMASAVILTFIAIMVFMASILPWQGYIGLSAVILIIIAIISIRANE